MEHSNYAAALFGAAAAWAQQGMNAQLAFGTMAENALLTATGIWQGAKYKLTSGQSFKIIPSGFQSWMSEGALKNMLMNENSALWEKWHSLKASIRYDQRQINDGYSGFSQAKASAEAAKHVIDEALEAFDGPGHSSKTGVGGYTSAEVKSTYAKLMSGLINGTITSQTENNGGASFAVFGELNSSYRAHNTKGSVTLSCLTGHVNSVLKEHTAHPSQVTSADVTVAQAVLGRAQTWEEQQTGCANAGVKAAQGYVTTDAETTAYGLMLAQQLASTMKLTEQELRK